MLRLVVAEEGERDNLMEGTLQEVVSYLQNNEELYNWLDLDTEPTSPLDLTGIESLRELEHELAKVDLDWWTMAVEEA